MSYRHVKSKKVLGLTVHQLTSCVAHGTPCDANDRYRLLIMRRSFNVSMETCQLRVTRAKRAQTLTIVIGWIALTGLAGLLDANHLHIPFGSRLALVTMPILFLTAYATRRLVEFYDSRPSKLHCQRNSTLEAH